MSEAIEVEIKDKIPNQAIAQVKEEQVMPNESIVKDQPINSVRLDFVDVTLDVDTKKGKKRILNGVSGYVKPGEILYIMGPSGGGKTTLLDFLCNRTKKTPEGSVFLNQQKWTEKEFKVIARYCKQHPQLYEVLTVQETLQFAASFFSKNQTDRNNRVDKVIQLLGLEGQRHTKIGGLFYRGISGGQKQRVSVGEQLVANPNLLFLDEPTSGLDSASAFKLMESLRNICQKTKITIISSIHQPSQRVFDMSDRLIVLAGGQNFGGNTAYFGKTKNLESHFNQIGFNNTTNSSVSEWILDEVNGDFGDPANIKQIIEKYKTSEQFSQTKKDMPLLESKDNITAADTYKFGGQIIKSGYFADMAYLISRGIKNNIKNPLAVGIRIMSYCMMALVLGSVWFGSADEPQAGDIGNIQGVLFFASAFFSMMTMSVIPIFIEDRVIMVKERSNGCYSLSAYTIAQFIVTTPFEFLIAITSGSIVFFMVGFDNSDGTPFLLFTVNMFFSILAAEGLVMLISYIYDNLLICIVLFSQVMGSFMVMCGFFIKKSAIPDGWIWLYYFNPTTYSLKNFLVEVFEDVTIKADMNAVPPAPVDFPGKAILEDLDMDDSDYGTNLLITIAFMIGFRLMSFGYSYFKHNGKK